MNYSGTGLGLTARFEGFRAKAYQDMVGVWTIGYGRTIGVKEGDETDEPTERAWMNRRFDQISAHLTAALKVPLTQAQFDACCDFAYNLGEGALEHSTLWAKLNAGDFAGAAAEFPKWDHAGGKEIEGLLKRRLAEQAEFLGKVA